MHFPSSQAGPVVFKISLQIPKAGTPRRYPRVPAPCPLFLRIPPHLFINPTHETRVNPAWARPFHLPYPPLSSPRTHRLCTSGRSRNLRKVPPPTFPSPQSPDRRFLNHVHPVNPSVNTPFARNPHINQPLSLLLSFLSLSFLFLEAVARTHLYEPNARHQSALPRTTHKASVSHRPFPPRIEHVYCNQPASRLSGESRGHHD